MANHTPMADSRVFRSTQYVSLFQRVPCKPETGRILNITTAASEGFHLPLPGLSNKSDIRLANASALRLTRVLSAVKHEDFARHSLRGDDIGILWHVTRPIDFALMVNLLDDLNVWLCRDGVATQLAPLVVVVTTVKFVR